MCRSIKSALCTGIRERERDCDKRLATGDGCRVPGQKRVQQSSGGVAGCVAMRECKYN